MTIYHKHHIIPRHMGGTDHPSNLIELTVEDHAEAHRLLYEKYSRQEDFIAWKALSGQITKEEARRLAVSSSLMGKKQSEEHIKKRVASRLKTRPHSTRGQKNKPASEERKRKISVALKGKPSARKGTTCTEETKRLMSESAKNRELFECPICKKKMQKASLIRHHGLNGERCNLNPTLS